MSRDVAETVEVVLDKHIQKTQGLLGGKAHIAGHRIRVMDIVFWHEKRGRSPDEIVAEIFPSITLSDVYAALTYYHDHRDEIEESFRREAELATEMKARFPSKLKGNPGG
jgi:uncharacterized protein (DUF433 family)